MPGRVALKNHPHAGEKEVPIFWQFTYPIEPLRANGVEMAKKLPRTQAGWIRVTKSEPCPICERDHYCSVSGDGSVAICTRVESEKAVPKANGWLHQLGNEHITPRMLPPRKKRLPERERIKKWTTVARHLHESKGSNVKRLAEQLGVGEWALVLLEVGYGTCAGRLCWSFPERNEHGAIVGISRRLVTPSDGRNKMSIGGRGLTYPPELDFQRQVGDDTPVLIVEGGSDTAAGITLGRATIGRPTCNGGLRHLVPMLRRLLDERRIVVVAERDYKPHDTLKPAVRKRHNPKCRCCITCWPGKAGARGLQKALKSILKRQVEWQFLPGKAKDLRAWLNSQDVDVESPGETFELGKRLFA